MQLGTDLLLKESAELFFFFLSFFFPKGKVTHFFFLPVGFSLSVPKGGKRYVSFRFALVLVLVASCVSNSVCRRSRSLRSVVYFDVVAVHVASLLLLRLSLLFSSLFSSSFLSLFLPLRRFETKFSFSREKESVEMPILILKPKRKKKRREEKGKKKNIRVKGKKFKINICY